MAKRRAGNRTTSLTPDHKKSGIDPIYLAAGGVPISLKSSWRELQHCFRPHHDPRSVHKLWGSKVAGVPFGAISGLPLGSPRKNSHLDIAFVESCRIYYKGEGGDFPQVWAVVSLVCPCCPWLVLAPRVLQLCTNHFVWVVCRPVWMSEACQLFLVPSRSSNTSLYPSKCCELGSVLRLLPFSLLSTWAHIWVL
jgi:hypothetical protein